jgi:hypothetical protein
MLLVLQQVLQNLVVLIMSLPVYGGINNQIAISLKSLPDVFREGFFFVYSILFLNE